MALLAVLVVGLYAGIGGAVAAAILAWPASWPYWAAVGAVLAVTVTRQTLRAERDLLDRTGAQPLGRREDPELHELLERLSLLAGLPCPTWA